MTDALRAEGRSRTRSSVELQLDLGKVVFACKCGPLRRRHE